MNKDIKDSQQGDQLHTQTIALVMVINAKTITAPLNLLCLSTALGKAGYITEVFDLSVQIQREEELLEGVRQHKFLWVGFSSLTASISLVAKIMEKIRRIDPDLPIVLGGIHASSLPELSLRQFPINAVCVGAGEVASVCLSKKLESGEKDFWSIPGIAALDNDSNFRFDDDLWRSMKNIPPSRPDWSKISLEDYQKCPMQFVRRGKTVASIVTTRGCPNHCSFCAAPRFSNGTLAHRDPVDVVDEIEYLAKEKHVDEINILDDNFNFDLSYAKTVLREWAKRDLGLFWKPPLGLWIHSYDDEWFSLLKQTGCYQVGFGIETGCQDILKRVGKKVDLARVPSDLEKYRKWGIQTFGCFILGLPGDTKETVRQTIRYAYKLPLNNAHASLLTPYPGSKIFHDAFPKGILSYNWDNYYHYHSQNLPFCEIDNSWLRRALRYFYLRFYSQPRRAVNLANEIRHTGIRPFFSIASQLLE